MRGEIHEQDYLNQLEGSGYKILRIEGNGLEEEQADNTMAAMRSGADIISQAVLLHERCGGRADILMRVNRPSDLGNWSYEVIDAKLARETKGASVLQLCLYSGLPSNIQVGKNSAAFFAIPIVSLHTVQIQQFATTSC